jgi:hypothetical protein
MMIVSRIIEPYQVLLAIQEEDGFDHDQIGMRGTGPKQK